MPERPTTPSDVRSPSALAELLAGVALLGRGLALITRRPRLFWLGALPPLVMSVLLTTLLVLLVARLPGLTVALTPFANGWSETTATAIRLLVGAALLAGSVLIMVVSFTTLTLALGSPVYDKISEAVDAELEPDLRPAADPVISSVGRALRQAVTLIGIALLVAPVIFLLGLVPVVGQVVSPVLSAVFGGWMLTVELVGSTFERRGFRRLSDRRSAMQRHRARALGFGIPVFVLSAIPFAGVVVFPVATAAGTLLARQIVPSPPEV